ncbi:hypothetical protein ACFXDE_28690 [Kitasatospora sp. NPDC059408]|uniref:hypothetical protein n=1 Tax=Kitasatospora sp. NPDC059408 TaxID=3346823 RepID=UPI0036A8FC1E
MSSTTTSTVWTAAWPENVLARYLTVGGAQIDLTSVRFRTRFLPKGRPYVGDTYHEVDGFTWKCNGCGTTGSVGVYGDPYLPNERQDAHLDANAHANECRSMPKPTS